MKTLAINNRTSSFFSQLFSSFNMEQKNHPFTSAINGLSQSDIQFVYHHLYIGRKLSLKIELNRVDIYYRTHFIGTLPELSTEKILKLIEKGEIISVTISDIKKVNYTTITGLELTIRSCS